MSPGCCARDAGGAALGAVRILVTGAGGFVGGHVARAAAASGHVVRAKQLLAVAAGASYTEAARVTRRKSNDAVAQLVARFNCEGLKAVEPKKGSGAPSTYRATERERILREARRIRQRTERQTGL